MAEYEEGEWWPEFTQQHPELLGDEFMEVELILNAPRVKLRDGDTIKLLMNHWTQGDIKFLPERPCYIKIKLVYKER